VVAVGQCLGYCGCGVCEVSSGNEFSFDFPEAGVVIFV